MKGKERNFSGCGVGLGIYLNLKKSEEMSGTFF